MPAPTLQLISAVLLAIALTACGKSEEKKADASSPSTAASAAQSSTRIYGREDGECFAGILRAVDAKRLTATDLRSWRDQLNGKDKEWFNGISLFYANASKTANTYMGKSPKELYDSKLITIDQFNVIEGYLDIYQDSDPQKAHDRSASTCIKLDFTQGLP